MNFKQKREANFSDEDTSRGPPDAKENFLDHHLLFDNIEVPLRRKNSTHIAGGKNLSKVRKHWIKPQKEFRIEESPKSNDSLLEFGSSDEKQILRDQNQKHMKILSNVSSFTFSQAERQLREIEGSPPKLSPEKMTR